MQILPRKQAIGVTGALALAVHLTTNGNGKQYASVGDAVADVEKTMDLLVTRCGVPCLNVIAYDSWHAYYHITLAAGACGALWWWLEGKMPGSAAASLCFDASMRCGG